jgi:hypothetical protein
MKELFLNPSPELFRQNVKQMSNWQLKTAEVRDITRIIVSDVKHGIREGWAESMNTARMLLGQPLVPYEEEVYEGDKEAYERLRTSIKEMTRRRSIRQEMMRH